MTKMKAIREFLWDEKEEEATCSCRLVDQLSGHHRCEESARKAEKREQFLRQMSNLAFAGSVRW